MKKFKLNELSTDVVDLLDDIVNDVTDMKSNYEVCFNFFFTDYYLVNDSECNINLSISYYRLNILFNLYEYKVSDVVLFLETQYLYTNVVSTPTVVEYTAST